MSEADDTSLFVGSITDEEKKIYDTAARCPELQLSAGANFIKLFTAVSYGFLWKDRAFVSGKPFKPSLMFAGKVWGNQFGVGTWPHPQTLD